MQNSLCHAAKIRVIHSFGPAESCWTRFEETADLYFFQSYDWLSNWYSTVGKELDLQICIVLIEYPEGNPLFLLPLGVQKQLVGSCLVWLGAPVGDYMGPILARDFGERFSIGEFEGLWARVVENLPDFDFIHLQRQPEYILGWKNPFMNLKGCRHICDAHYTELLGEWESYYTAKLGSKSRQTMRRKGRRLAENGRVKFFLASKDEDIDFIMDKLSEQKIVQLGEKGYESILSDRRVLDCYRDFAKYFRKEGLGIISALWVGDRITATNFSVIFRNRLYYILLSFEKGKLSKYSPGQFLLEHLMQYAFEQGVEIFDFTIGDEAYKSVWCEKKMGLYSCMQGKSRKGSIYAYLLGRSLDMRIALQRCDVLRRLVRRGRRLRGLPGPGP